MRPACKHVESVHVQHELKNLQGRSVRLDILATDTAGQIYNAEIQRDDRGAGVRRARYHSSLMDANITAPGESCQNLSETYVIFITERDVLKGGLPIYHINRTIEEMGHAAFGDGTHIIYVNSQIKNETALGRLMHDFSCINADDMTYPILAERVRYFKEDTKGVEAMCKSLEDMRKQTAIEERFRIAARLISVGKLNTDEIAECSGLSVAEVEALAQRQSA